MFLICIEINLATYSSDRNNSSSIMNYANGKINIMFYSLSDSLSKPHEFFKENETFSSTQTETSNSYRPTIETCLSSVNVTFDGCRQKYVHKIIPGNITKTREDDLDLRKKYRELSQKKLTENVALDLIPRVHQISSTEFPLKIKDKSYFKHEADRTRLVKLKQNLHKYESKTLVLTTRNPYLFHDKSVQSKEKLLSAGVKVQKSITYSPSMKYLYDFPNQGNSKSKPKYSRRNFKKYKENLPRTGSSFLDTELNKNNLIKLRKYPIQRKHQRQQNNFKKNSASRNGKQHSQQFISILRKEVHRKEKPESYPTKQYFHDKSYEHDVTGSFRTSRNKKKQQQRITPRWKNQKYSKKHREKYRILHKSNKNGFRNYSNKHKKFKDFYPFSKFVTIYKADNVTNRKGGIKTNTKLLQNNYYLFTIPLSTTTKNTIDYVFTSEYIPLHESKESRQTLASREIVVQKPHKVNKFKNDSVFNETQRRLVLSGIQNFNLTDKEFSTEQKINSTILYNNHNDSIRINIFGVGIKETFGRQKKELVVYDAYLRANDLRLKEKRKREALLLIFSLFCFTVIAIIISFFALLFARKLDKGKNQKSRTKNKTLQERILHNKSEFDILHCALEKSRSLKKNQLESHKFSCEKYCKNDEQKLSKELEEKFRTKPKQLDQLKKKNARFMRSLPNGTGNEHAADKKMCDDIHQPLNLDFEEKFINKVNFNNYVSSSDEKDELSSDRISESSSADDEDSSGTVIELEHAFKGNNLNTNKHMKNKEIKKSDSMCCIFKQCEICVGKQKRLENMHPDKLSESCDVKSDGKLLTVYLDRTSKPFNTESKCHHMKNGTLEHFSRSEVNYKSIPEDLSKNSNMADLQLESYNIKESEDVSVKREFNNSQRNKDDFAKANTFRHKLKTPIKDSHISSYNKQAEMHLKERSSMEKETYDIREGSNYKKLANPWDRILVNVKPRIVSTKLVELETNTSSCKSKEDVLSETISVRSEKQKRKNAVRKLSVEEINRHFPNKSDSDSLTEVYENNSEEALVFCSRDKTATNKIITSSNE